ncbi:MAG TPA: LysR substrate-binding domain-containing protein [Arenicellales bacterium]|nr:LysR substrate-binding domain-containing protein [Arenicellales bacterium]
MHIKISALRVFVAVAEYGNIQGAASRIGRSVSAVSVTLKQLETQLGIALFESDRKSTLTPTGRYLLEAARAEILRHERAMAAIRAYTRGEIGRLELACIPSVGAHLLPEVIQRCTARFPGVELDVRDSDSLSVRRRVESGDVEIGIAGQQEGSRTLAFRPLFQDDLVVVCPAGSRLAGNKDASVDWDEIIASGEQVIANGIMRGLPRDDGSTMADGSRVLVRNTTSLLALVKAGVGITVLPRLAVPGGSGDGLTALAFRQPGLRRTVGVYQRAGMELSPAAREFLALLDQYVAERGRTAGDLLPVDRCAH